MRNPIRQIALPVVACALLSAGPALSQSKYSTWSDPAKTGPEADGGGVQQLLERLNALIDSAEKARAADPVFLKDLRALAGDYAGPAQKTVFADDFADGEFAANSAWTVTEGRYWVEQGWGLRSAVTPEDVPAETQPQSKQNLGLAILGAVLKQATEGSGATVSQSAAPAPRAAIHAAVAIANAFTMAFEIYSTGPQGRLDIGPYQGAGQAGGYRLAYTPGGRLELLRVGAASSAVVQTSAAPLALEDQKTHALIWTRDGQGKMRVTLDGTEILATADRGYRDPFDGIAIVNHGGDYIIRRVSVSAGN